AAVAEWYGIGSGLPWSRVRSQYHSKDPPCRAAMHVKSCRELKRPPVGVCGS
ncbi:hypothetical protein TNCV_292411, partial [Trichonephila clavipes]